MHKSRAIVKKKQKINPRHGVYSWLRTGRVNPSIRGHKELQRYLMSLERELTELQGSGGMTAGREILIKSTVEAFGAVLLAGMYCKRAGLLRPDMARRGVIEFQPVLGKQFLAFINTIRQNLMALGLDPKKAEADFCLADYIRATDRAKEKSQIKPRKYRPGAERGQGEAEGQGMDDSAGRKQNDCRATSSDISGEAEGGIDCSSGSGQDRASESGGIGQPRATQIEGNGPGEGGQA